MSVDTLERPPILATEEAAAVDLPIVRYSPQSPLRQPVQLIGEIFGDIWRSRELVGILFLRDLKAQFRQSYLGYSWLIVPPLLTTAVWLFLNSQQVVTIGDTGMPYALFVLIGTVFWQSFMSTLLGPLDAFNIGKPVFMKLKVPPEAFIAAGSARAVFDFLLSLLLLVPIFIYYRVVPSPAIMLLPFALVAMYFLATAMGLLFLPIGSLYHDVSRGLNVMLRFAMYLTPVIYPVPEEGLVRQLLLLNPMTHILEFARGCLVSGSSDYGWLVVGLMPVWLALCLVGLVVLRVVMPHLVARMGM